MDIMDPKNIEYIIASKGLFQRFPIEQDISVSGTYECIVLWRSAIDRALLDILKGPVDVGKKNYEDAVQWVTSQDFKATCSLGLLDPDFVREHMFKTITIHKEYVDS